MVNNIPNSDLDPRIIDKGTSTTTTASSWVLALFSQQPLDGSPLFDYLRHRFRVSGSSTPSESFFRVSPSELNDWVHLTVVWDQNLVRMFLNGSRAVTGVISERSSDPIIVGNNNAGGRCFPGILDELYLFNHALQPAEIERLADPTYYSSRPDFSLVIPPEIAAEEETPFTVQLTFPPHPADPLSVNWIVLLEPSVDTNDTDTLDTFVRSIDLQTVISVNGLESSLRFPREGNYTLRVEVFGSLVQHSIVEVEVGPPRPREVTSDTSFPLPIVLGAAAGGLLLCCLLILFVVLLVFLRRRKRSPPSRVESSVNLEMEEPETNYSSLTLPLAPPAPQPRLSRLERPTISVEKKNQFLELDFNELEFAEAVGQGAFGVVYRGKWRGGEVAIKCIKDTLTQQELNEFILEAQLMKSIRPHSNVVQFQGVSLDPLVIVTEFLHGGSLYNYLRSEDGLTMKTNEMIRILSSIAAGMYHLTSEGIVHRDLAARNILLSTQLIPKIADFGMSRVLLSEADGNVTQSNTGPLKWMAPESLLDRIYSEKTDVWSFGILTCEVILKTDPYPGQSAVQVATKVGMGKLRPELPEGTPAILRNVVDHCLQYHSDSRPSFSQLIPMLSGSG